MVGGWRSSACAFNLVNLLGDVMKLKLNEKTRQAAERYTYDNQVVDQIIVNECNQYAGLDWAQAKDIANELISVMLLDGGEVDDGSKADELACAILIFAYKQAFTRISIVWGIPIEQLEERDETLDFRYIPTTKE